MDADQFSQLYNAVLYGIGAVCFLLGYMGGVMS